VGLIATLVKLTRAASSTKGAAPGKSVVAQAEGFPGQILTPEVYQGPGVYAIPADGTKGVYLPVGGGERYGVVVAVHNYQVEVDVGGQGGMAIYSTTADGATVKAKIVLKPDGTIEINGDSKRLVTADELQSALTALCGTLAGHVHPAHGTPSPALAGLACDISAAKTTTVKTGG